MLSPPKLRRKRHRNSRLGCDTCKKRKVKCLEDLPQCKNCIKYKVKCDYLDKLPEELDAIRQKALFAALSAALSAAPPAGALLPPIAAAAGAAGAPVAPGPLFYFPLFLRQQDVYVPQPQQLYPQIYYMNPMTLFALMPLTSLFPAPGAPPPEPPPPPAPALPTTLPPPPHAAAPVPEPLPTALPTAPSAPSAPTQPLTPTTTQPPPSPPKLHRNKHRASTYLRTTVKLIGIQRRRHDNQGFFDAMLELAYDGDRRAWTAALELGRYVVSLKLRSQ